MSVLIKGMEMPRSCEECELADWYNGDIYCYALRYTVVVSEFEQLYAMCPLAEVPTPHGRLIDENWLFSFISTNNSLGATHYGCLTKEEIQLAPTVIESEE